MCWWVFISCSSFKKWHQQMLWIPQYSLLSVQGKVEHPEGLFASPKHPPATTWGVLQGEAAVSWEARQPCFCFQADGLWWDESCASALARVILKLRHLWGRWGVQREGICWGSWRNSSDLFAVHQGPQMVGCSSCDAILVLGLLLWGLSGCEVLGEEGV